MNKGTLVLTRPTEDTEGKWFDFDIRGVVIRLKVRALSSEIMKTIRKRHKKTKMKKDPSTRQLAHVDIFDEEKISDDIIDHVLESFEGVQAIEEIDGVDTPVDLEVNLTNKKLLANTPSIDDNPSVSDFLFDTAKELAATTTLELEKQVKN